MDRRRLEMAHLKFAVLNVCNWYSDLSFSDVVIKPVDLDENMQVGIYTCRYSNICLGWMFIVEHIISTCFYLQN